MKRRTLDLMFSLGGVAIALLLAVAGLVLQANADFANDYVGRQLAEQNITFKTASADLNANFYQVLDSVTFVFKEFDKTIIDVEGHTDSDGSDSYNLQLSQQRAGSGEQQRHGDHHGPDRHDRL